jgi:hypothetical protein
VVVWPVMKAAAPATVFIQSCGNLTRTRIMKKSLLLASAVMMSAALLSGGASAEGAPQTVDLVKVDVQKLSAGYRSSKVVSSSVVNDAKETIGKIDDLLVSRDGKQPYTVLSIGGFLGTIRKHALACHWQLGAMRERKAKYGHLFAAKPLIFPTTF